ncbi:putative fasciclin-like arabinogalactan protein 20 isoform X1 [Solanum dulcamara]|uniref:putative fasciclin-like arabinogalactan protein 20 isoform X1 n=1 Tax=Solanum dulcamara TaxID=45834 RepID=UPI002485EA9F|nr:putative fasciclin-like arabinogalactan protein 20 isoform X1 [Solanum dulcamara]
MAFFKAFFFFFSYLLCFSTAQSPPPPPAPPQSLLNAAETLSNSGYISMSLTLELITDTVLSRAAKNSLTGSALTIFSPPDSSFTDFGQPSLSHILLHFSPVSISLSSLQSLPFSSKIPSLSPSSSLYVTSSPSDSRVSINNVEIVGSPIYDDGFVVVFAIEHFFTQNFTKPETNRNPDFKPSPQCIRFDPFSRFYEVSLLLKSKGYLIMSSFLELQLIGFLKNTELKLTVFAPMDDAIVGFSGDFPEYQQLFLRHLVPCVLYWTDLNDMVNGTEFKNYINGLSLKITQVNDVSFVNGVEITYPDLYYSDWLVVHGLQSLIPLPDEIDDEMDEDPGKPERMIDVSIAPDHSEF